MLIRGNRGPEVLKLNKTLISIGYQLPETDLFGVETDATVRHFQEANKLTKD